MSILDQTKTKMTNAIEHLKEKLKGIRTGRANTGMVDGVTVDVYGTQMRIKELASVTTPEARQILIAPFDANSKGMISKAIEKANLGFMPMVDGNVIRIKIPPMDEKMREDMKKICHKEGEEAKIVIRNLRRDSNEAVRKQKKDSIIGEDEVKKMEKGIQDLTDKFCKECDDLVAKKEKEVSTI
ncbi:MAG: ribosome recycling factor [Parachlamydiaceae bacterium]|nr:ribosome recycling factor [Parachlamydiaceae bacterium]